MDQDNTWRRGMEQSSCEDVNNGATENREVTADENEVQSFSSNAVNVENQECNNSNHLRSADSSYNIRVESDIQRDHPQHPGNDYDNLSNSNKKKRCFDNANLLNRCGKHLFKTGILSAFITLVGVVLFVYGLVVSWSVMTISGIIVFVVGVLTTCSLFPIFYRLQNFRRQYCRSTSQQVVVRTGPQWPQNYQEECHPSAPLEYDHPPVYSTIPLPASLSSPTGKSRDFRSDLVHQNQGAQAAGNFPPSYHDAAHF